MGGFFVEPTVFTEVADDMTIMKFKDLDDAIRRANASKYGLAAGICTRDIGKTLKATSRLKAGTVWVNCYDNFDAAAAFGGYKESGIGSEKSEYALRNYLEVKCVMIPIDR